MKPDNTYHLPTETLDGLDEAQQRSMQEVWNFFGDVQPAAPVTDKAVAKDRLFQAIQAQKSAAVQVERSALRLVSTASVLKTVSFRFASVAAALVVALSIALSPSSDHYRVAPGLDAQFVSLNDGSSVLLAPGSRLSVPDGFGENDRTVVLHGEAFFDVSEGPAPFKVRTIDAETTVLGTRFNVRSWPGSLTDMTQVVVESGRVSVAVEDLDAIVEPGEALTASEEVLTPVETDPAYRLAWRTGGFSYDNELIGTIIDDVERRFDVRIAAPASIRLRPITIHRTEVTEAADFIGDIAATISVRFRTTANGFEMYLD